MNGHNASNALASKDTTMNHDRNKSKNNYRITLLGQSKDGLDVCQHSIHNVNPNLSSYIVDYRSRVVVYR
jgi:hypothetical protein